MAYFGTQPNEVKKNTGLYTPSKILQLTKDGHWGGSLELIQEQIITSTTAAVQFTNLANTPHDVYFLTFDNVTTDTDDVYLTLQLSNDNGSSYETSNYDYAHQVGTASSSFSEARSTTAGQFFLSGNIGNASYEKANGYAYLYNLLDSSKFSFISHQSSDYLSSAVLRMMYGGGTYHTAETINAFKLLMNSGNITTGNFKLYGVKQI
jgi:hypothetical protein